MNITIRSKRGREGLFVLGLPKLTQFPYWAALAPLMHVTPLLADGGSGDLHEHHSYLQTFFPYFVLLFMATASFRTLNT